MKEIEEIRKSQVESFAKTFDGISKRVEFKYMRLGDEIVKLTWFSAPPYVPVKITLNSIDPSYREVHFKIDFDDKEDNIKIYTSIHFSPNKLCIDLMKKIEDVVNETLKEDCDRVVSEYNFFAMLKKQKK